MLFVEKRKTHLRALEFLQHAGIPRESIQWRALYDKRTSVERLFGRMKEFRHFGIVHDRGRQDYFACLPIHVNSCRLRHLGCILRTVFEEGGMMAEDYVTAYQDALRSLQAARVRAEHYVSVIRGAASRLADWQQVRVSDVDVPFPIEIPLTNSINGKEWPTPIELAAALGARHSALHAAGNAYRRIPDSQREVVQPPPSR